MSALSLVSSSASGSCQSKSEMVFRSAVALRPCPRKSSVTAPQSNVRFVIDFTVTGGSLIWLKNW